MQQEVRAFYDDRWIRLPSAFEFGPREQEQIWFDEVHPPFLSADAFSAPLPRRPACAYFPNGEDSDLPER